MSHKVVTLVCSRIVGSAAQKAVLTNMADKASDGGEGIFASKATIAAETELGVSTVKRAIKELADKGLISESGLKACINGHTVIYNLNITAIAALPEWKPEGRSKRTPSRADPVQAEPRPQRTVTPSRVDPHPVQSGPQTILEPFWNNGGSGSAGASNQTEREQILAAMGVGPDGIAGPGRFIGGQGDMAEARRWLALPNITLPAVLEELRRVSAAKQDGPPKSFKYFTAAMQRISGALSAPPLSPTHSTNTNSPADLPPRRVPPQIDLSKFDDYGNRIA